MSYWDNPEFDIVYDFVELDFEGTPIWLTIPDWEDVKLGLSFKDENGAPFESDYLQTDKGLLRIDSKRLVNQLKEFKGKKGRIMIQRWCEGKDKRSTTYNVEFEPAIVSKKKQKPKPKT